MKKICIIGVGNLGYRHFQALLNIKFDSSIYLVDPCFSTLNTNINSTKYSNPRIQNVQVLSNIDQLPNTIDLVIISTNADVRADVTKRLIKSKSVQYILFEKILFQKISSYHEIKNLLSKYNIVAWVNCPLRMYPHYKEIKRTVAKKAISVKVSGWDIACNTIHFIDLVEWLSGEKLTRVLADNLSKTIVKSKRKGFVEIIGELNCKFNGGSELAMILYPDGGQQRKIVILTEGNRYEIDEVARRCKNTQGVQVEEFDIKPLYQSELTNLVATDIIAHQKCELVSFEDSLRQHIKLIEAFKKHIESVSEEYIIDNCVPVT